MEKKHKNMKMTRQKQNDKNEINMTKRNDKWKKSQRCNKSDGKTKIWTKKCVDAKDATKNKNEVEGKNWKNNKDKTRNYFFLSKMTNETKDETEKLNLVLNARSF